VDELIANQHPEAPKASWPWTVPTEANFRYYTLIVTKRREVAMLLISLGALCMIAGILIATLSTLRRGRLSQSHREKSRGGRDTLEPSGRGDRLNLVGDLPGIGLMLIGALLIFVGALR